MRDVTRSDSSARPTADNGVDKPTYEAPKIVPAGNVRDLLALVTGPSADGDPMADGQNPH